MRKKAMVFGMFLGIFLMFGSLDGVYSADEPSKLLVVRGGGNTLWKATCNGDICSAWSQITGLFTQQPTLVWDTDALKYYLYGVGEDGQIWSSTFGSLGNHNDDWTVLPGSSLSPIAAVGGGHYLAFNYHNSDSTTALSFGSVTDILATSITCPYGGYVVARASGSAFLQTSSGVDGAIIYLVDKSEGSDDPYYVTALHAMEFATSFPFSHQRIFHVASGKILSVYLTGQKNWDTTTPVTIVRPTLTLTGVYYLFNHITDNFP